MLGGCAGLPPQEGRIASSALLDTAGTAIGQAVAPLLVAHPGRSGVYALVDGRDAFAARAVLANSARRSLDVQYYIWHNDISGALLFGTLHAAADRGVRVRLLLDDNGAEGLDDPWRCSTPTPISKCGCITRSCCAAHASSAI